MMKNKLSWRGVGFGLALTASSMVVPTPASATLEEYRECLHNCYIAYYVMTYQPSFYQMCAYDCRQYDN
jgi:hypothetical protein